MSTTAIHRPGKVFAVIVVCCAIVSFATVYWLSSSDKRDDAGTKAGFSQTTAQLPPTAGASEPQKLAPAVVSVPPAAIPKPGNEAAHLSITYRYKADTARGSDNADGSVPLVLRDEVIELHTDSKGCDVCSNSSVRTVPIPRGCAYSSHTLTQLHREPFAPIEQLNNEFTKYLDRLDTNAKGQLEAITLIVNVRKTKVSDVNPSITMRLTVVSACRGDG